VVKDKDKKDEKPKPVNVLDLKRCTGIGVAMKKLKLPWQQMPGAIIGLDPQAFGTTEDIGFVMQCIPTADEANMLRSYVQ
jgi:hypothetical protein